VAVAKALTSDFFTLFDLPPLFAVDLALLDARYREIQSEVHPDRFAQAGDAQRRLSMQWATRVNEGYQTLKKPLLRAKYLLGLAGHDLDAESNTAMPASFLMEQIEWRESIMEARSSADQAALETLENRLHEEIQTRFEALGALLNSQSWQQAAEDICCLMFLEKLGSEINDALAELDT